MDELLQSFIGSNGTAVQIISIIGVLRLVMKPASEIVHTIVAATPTKADDEVLAKVESHPIYLKFLFLVDWLTSVKVKK
jgi:hypothetical protein